MRLRHRAHHTSSAVADALTGIGGRVREGYRGGSCGGTSICPALTLVFRSDSYGESAIEEPHSSAEMARWSPTASAARCRNRTRVQLWVQAEAPTTDTTALPEA